MEYNFTYREKDGGWQCIVSYKNSIGQWRQRSRQGFKSKAAARHGADKLLMEIKRHGNLFAGTNNMTFRQFADVYLAAQEKKLTWNSVQTYRQTVNAFGGLDERPLAEIRPMDIENIIAELPYKQDTKSTYLAKLKTMLRAAVYPYELISRNPAEGVRVVKEKRAKKINALTNECVRTILSELSGADKLIVGLAVYAGLRAGEITGLRSEDAVNGVISVKYQYARVNGRECRLRALKTENSYREIPVPQELDIILEENRELLGNLALPVMQVNRHLKRFGNIHLHDFRHTYATRLLAEGMDIRTVAALLGDTVATVLNVYVHYTDDMRAAAAEKLRGLKY